MSKHPKIIKNLLPNFCISLGTNGEIAINAIGYAANTKPAQNWETFLNYIGKKGAITECVEFAISRVTR